MTQKRRKVFLDTSVVVAAVLSSTGGARQLFRLATIRMLTLVVGPNVLRECEDVARRKVPASLPMLAQLLDAGMVQTSPAPTEEQVEMARQWVQHLPDAYVLAEAIQAKPDWFVTHDKEHFLKSRYRDHLPFTIGTSGDLIQAIQNDLIRYGKSPK